MKGRVLVIEDNAFNLELMTYLLEASGYCVLTAGDGRSGLRLASTTPPDIVLCDLQMPVMNGYEFAREMKSQPRSCTIPLVAVTALAMPGDRAAVLAAGFDGYLPKPIDPATFIGEMEAFLGKRTPSLAEAEIPAAIAVPTPHPYTGRRVIVVDNVQAHLDLASGLLEHHGYRVETSRNARDALERARADPPDLILSDVAMPEGDGYEFLQAVRADPLLHHVPFVLLTSTMLDEKDRRRGLALGATRFLTRPIEPEALLRELESCLPARDASPLPRGS